MQVDEGLEARVLLLMTMGTRRVSLRGRGARRPDLRRRDGRARGRGRGRARVRRLVLLGWHGLLPDAHRPGEAAGDEALLEARGDVRGGHLVDDRLAARVCQLAIWAYQNDENKMNNIRKS